MQLGRLARFYEARGYYGTQVMYDLKVDHERSLLDVEITVGEGQPVIVSQVDVDRTGGPRFPDELPIKQGEIFAEESYAKAEQLLQEYYLKRGYAHVQTERKAEINLEQNQVRVWYRVDPGPPTVFGETTIEGTRNVDPELISRELSYRPGEVFSSEKVAASRQNARPLGAGSIPSRRTWIMILPRSACG